MSKLYEVSTEELDFLNDVAKECGVTGSRIMGGGFGGCTINLVKDAYYDRFIKYLCFRRYRNRKNFDAEYAFLLYFRQRPDRDH